MMAYVELQIRTTRFCDVVKNIINMRKLTSPQQDTTPEITGKFLERIKCTNCEFATSQAGDNGDFFILNATLAFSYYESLATIRNSGSLVASPTRVSLLTVPIRFSLDATNPKSARLVYQIGFSAPESIPLPSPGPFPAQIHALKANADIIAIRIGTETTDQIYHEPVDIIGNGDWIERVPGVLIAEILRGLLDDGLASAVAPPPPPDPNKPWLPKPKPNEMRRGDAVVAAWSRQDDSVAIATGGIVAMNACPLFKVDLDIDFQLSVQIEFPTPASMKTRARLTWEADSTWCDVFSTLLFVPYGIAVHILAEDSASKTILKKSLNVAGYRKVDQTDDSITFEGFQSPPPAPTPDFDYTHSEVTGAGIQTGGLVVPKGAYPKLTGFAVPARAGFNIDCNLRAVKPVFNPAQVIFGGAPRIFFDAAIFDPPGAWKITTSKANMQDPHSKDVQTVLTFDDPPGGRLPAGTRTSVFIFTELGARWVDLGAIPAVAERAPDESKHLMDEVCDSLNNPWGKGMTHLGWGDDILLDPDYATVTGLDALRLWTVGFALLPEEARIELIAVSKNGGERLLGVVEGQTSAALELVTAADETLALRSDVGFSAPRPLLARSWLFPTSAHDIGFDPSHFAAMGGLIAVAGQDETVRIFDPRLPPESSDAYTQDAPRADGQNGEFTEALGRQIEYGRSAWGSMARIDKKTVAVVHRGQLVVGALAPQHRVQ
jgi:hypothetical protein